MRRLHLSGLWLTIGAAAWSAGCDGNAGQEPEVADASNTVSEPKANIPSAGSPSAILVDASRDGGVWWFPQYPTYDPNQPHQGRDLAEYLRSLGFAVDELGRGTRITDDVLNGYTKVIRASSCGPYSETELQAYRSFLGQGGTLFLISDHLKNPACAPDGLAEMLGLAFSGAVGGNVTVFADHPITAGVRDLSYRVGSVLVRYEPGSVEVLGWLEGGDPVMGVLHHPSAKIFFMGDLNTLERLPQPLTDNLVEWGFCVSTCVSRGDLRVVITTTGTSLDPDGYLACVDEADAADCLAAPVNGTLTMPRLSTGSHTVRLVGVADNCTVKEAGSRTVEIAAGATAEVGFHINCGVQVDLVPYEAAGYRFKVLADSMSSAGDFAMPALDDAATGFLDGGAPFGTLVSSYGCRPGRTEWPAETDLLLRRAFDLPRGVSGVKVRVAIDNDVQVFVNGVDITAVGEPGGMERGFLEGGFQRHEGCAETDSFVFTVPDTLVYEGTNWVAVHARDRGGDAYADIRVTAQR